MSHTDLDSVSEFELLEKIDGYLMAKEDEIESLLDWQSRFFAYLAYVTVADKMKKPPNPEEIKAMLFKTRKEREEEQLEAIKEQLKPKKVKQKEYENEQNALLADFGL